MQVMQRLGAAGRYLGAGLAAVFFLVTIGAERAEAGDFVILRAGDEIPTGKFIYTVMDVRTGDVAFGYVAGDVSPEAAALHRRVDTRLPGHTHLAAQLMGFGDDPDEFVRRLPQTGRGRVAGGGFVLAPDGSATVIHPMMSNKSAGDLEPPLRHLSPDDWNTMNPRLPKQNLAWRALLAEDYLVDMYKAMARRTGVPLMVDPALYFHDSEYYRFNAEKQSVFRNSRVDSFETRYYGPGVVASAVNQANAELAAEAAAQTGRRSALARFARSAGSMARSGQLAVRGFLQSFRGGVTLGSMIVDVAFTVGAYAGLRAAGASSVWADFGAMTGSLFVGAAFDTWVLGASVGQAAIGVGFAGVVMLGMLSYEIWSGIKTYNANPSLWGSDWWLDSIRTKGFWSGGVATYPRVVAEYYGDLLGRLF